MDSMLYIEWSDKNILGITIIDEQHRGIVTTINSFYYFIQKGCGRDAIKPTLNMLEQYTKLHFQTEEDLLEESGYRKFDEPWLTRHINLHKELMRKTIDIALDPKACEDPHIALKFLKAWWLDHINVEDRQYVAYVKGKL